MNVTVAVPPSAPGEPSPPFPAQHGLLPLPPWPPVDTPYTAAFGVPLAFGPPPTVPLVEVTLTVTVGPAVPAGPCAAVEPWTALQVLPTAAEQVGGLAALLIVQSDPEQVKVEPALSAWQVAV